MVQCKCSSPNPVMYASLLCDILWHLVYIKIYLLPIIMCISEHEWDFENWSLLQYLVCFVIISIFLNILVITRKSKLQIKIGWIILFYFIFTHKKITQLVLKLLSYKQRSSFALKIIWFHEFFIDTASVQYRYNIDL